LAVVLTLGVARAVVGIEMLPGWTGDPSALPVPTTSLTPTWVLGLNVATIAAGAAVLLMMPGAVGRGVLGALALGTAAVGVAWHGLGRGLDLSRLNVDHLVVGTSWLAAGWTGAACARAAVDERLRRMVVAFIAGVVVMVAAKGAVQVLVEHPATVASFERNKAAVLEANGWSAGSAMARAYEHRLRQSEATGWFGLANVAATFGAAGAVLGVGLTAAWVRSAARGGLHGIGAAALAVAGTGLVVMAGSKGGVAGAMIGVAVGVAGLAASRWAGESGMRGALSRWWAWLPMGAAAMVVIGIAARGAIGERLGERSLLFRWFYVEAAARITAGSPIAGVGPAGFKEAYLSAKNPLSPEEVGSPHCWPLDLSAGLGLLGAGLVAAFVWWVWRLGASGGGDRRAEGTGEGVDVRAEIRPIFVGLSLATALGLWIEMPVGTPEGGLTRLAGLAGGLVAAAAVLRACPAWWWLSGAGTAAACLSLIDLAPSGVGSGPMALALVAGMGLACGTKRAEEQGVVGGATCGATGRGRFVCRAALAVAGVIGVAAAGAGLPRVWSWESQMRRSAEVVMEPARLRQELTLMWDGRAGGMTSAERADVSERLRRVAGMGVEDSREAIVRAVDSARMRSLAVAAEGLDRAAETMPAHTGTREAASRVRLQLARGLWDADRAGAEREIERALGVSEVREGDPSSAWAWRATVLESVGRIRGEAGAVWGPAAVGAMERAVSADPWSAVHPVRLAELCSVSGDAAGASRWAARALEADERMRLDPSGTRRLTVEQRARMRELSGG
jgi:hypothetical protein